MKRRRDGLYGAIGVAMQAALVAAGGCRSSGVETDGGVSDGATPQSSAGLCEPDGWCPALPSDFATMPMLVGDELLAHSIDGVRVFARRAGGWQPIECPAEAGADARPQVIAGMTSETVVRCGARLYRWGSSGMSPLPWTGDGLQSMPTVALADVVFFGTIDARGQPAVTRCASSACVSFEAPPFVSLAATSAEDFAVITAGGALRHGASGWTAVAPESVAAGPTWPPSDAAQCLDGERWVRCDASPGAVGPFRLQQRSARRVLLRGRLDELVTYDGAQTQRLQSSSLAGFQRQHWPELDVTPGRSRIEWLFPTAVDGALERGAERLFLSIGAAVVAEGTHGPHTVEARIYTRLGDQPWQPLGAPLGACEQMSATSVENVWVRCAAGVRHFDGSAWSEPALPTASTVCALSDGSAIVLYTSDGASMAARVRAGEAPSQQRPANRLVNCTHDDVFAIDDSGVIFHRTGDRWADIDAPPVAADQRDLGVSDLGLTVRDNTRGLLFVWDGAQWQASDQARPSFDWRRQVLRLSSHEWAIKGYAPTALMVRARR